MSFRQQGGGNGKEEKGYGRMRADGKGEGMRRDERGRGGTRGDEANFHLMPSSCKAPMFLFVPNELFHGCIIFIKNCLIPIFMVVFRGSRQS